MTKNQEKKLAVSQYGMIYRYKQNKTHYLHQTFKSISKQKRALAVCARESQASNANEIVHFIVVCDFE